MKRWKKLMAVTVAVVLAAVLTGSLTATGVLPGAEQAEKAARARVAVRPSAMGRRFIITSSLAQPGKKAPAYFLASVYCSPVAAKAAVCCEAVKTYCEVVKVTVARVPWPGLLSNSSKAPWRRAMAKQSESPSPAPPSARLRALSAR